MNICLTDDSTNVGVTRVEFSTYVKVGRYFQLDRRRSKRTQALKWKTLSFRNKMTTRVAWRQRLAPLALRDEKKGKKGPPITWSTHNWLHSELQDLPNHRIKSVTKRPNQHSQAVKHSLPVPKKPEPQLARHVYSKVRNRAQSIYAALTLYGSLATDPRISCLFQLHVMWGLSAWGSCASPAIIVVSALSRDTQE
jgi:hypothetical protein